jgi:hypothetical protein
MHGANDSADDVTVDASADDSGGDAGTHRSTSTHRGTHCSAGNYMFKQHQIHNHNHIRCPLCTFGWK